MFKNSSWKKGWKGFRCCPVPNIITSNSVISDLPDGVVSRAVIHQSLILATCAKDYFGKLLSSSTIHINIHKCYLKLDFKKNPYVVHRWYRHFWALTHQGTLTHLFHHTMETCDLIHQYCRSFFFWKKWSTTSKVRLVWCCINAFGKAALMLL